MIKSEEYIRRKLKLSTLRADIPNNEKITYNQLIRAISAQMNELKIAIQANPDLLRPYPATSSLKRSTLSKLTVDFLEDYASDPAQPRVYLLNIRCAEFTTPPPSEVAASHSDLVQIARSLDVPSRMHQARNTCHSGEYCQLETSPLVPRHLLPIISELFSTTNGGPNLEE